MKKNRAKRVLKIILVNIAILVLLLLILEFVLNRITGKTKMVTGQEFVICDREFFFIPHPTLGYFYIPGNYDCTLAHLKFNLGVLPDSSRNTGFKGFAEQCESTKEIYLFGCSFTWGHGLKDNETMAYQIQSKSSCIEVKNFGIGAGSDVQSYILLKSLIERGEIPDIAILNYGSIHDERNAFKGEWRKMWQIMLLENKINGSTTDYGNLSFPYAEIDENDSLKFDFFSVYKIMDEISIKDQSEIVNRLSKIKLRDKIKGMQVQDIAFEEKQYLSFRVMKEMYHLCKANNIDFIVSNIYPNDETAQVVEMIDKAGIPNTNIAVDIFDSQFNLEPVDGHPNFKANAIYGDRLYNFLTNENYIQR